jgi:hypothetical protein
MATRIIDNLGREYEFLGEYRAPRKGDRLLTDGGIVILSSGDWEHCEGSIRAIVHPIPKLHVFGGVTFEETGETRMPRVGEWVMGSLDSRPRFLAGGDWSVMGDCIIVRPVSVEGQS